MSQVVEAREKAEELPPLLVSKRQSCRMLGDVCMRTLENWINAGLIKAKKRGGRTLIPYSELVRFAKK